MVRSDPGVPLDLEAGYKVRCEARYFPQPSLGLVSSQISTRSPCLTFISPTARLPTDFGLLPPWQHHSRAFATTSLKWSESCYSQICKNGEPTTDSVREPSQSGQGFHQWHDRRGTGSNSRNGSPLGAGN